MLKKLCTVFTALLLVFLMTTGMFAGCKVNDEGLLSDYKSSLQEYCAKNHVQVVYEIIGETGPEHNRVFSAKVTVTDGLSAVGEGRSKKDAEQLAARRLLEILNNK